MRVASAGLVYWVARFFLLGTKARILGLTEPHTKGSSLLGLGAALGFYFFFFLKHWDFPSDSNAQAGRRNTGYDVVFQYTTKPVVLPKVFTFVSGSKDLLTK